MLLHKIALHLATVNYLNGNIVFAKISITFVISKQIIKRPLNSGNNYSKCSWAIYVIWLIVSLGYLIILNANATLSKGNNEIIDYCVTVDSPTQTEQTTYAWTGTATTRHSPRTSSLLGHRPKLAGRTREAPVGVSGTSVVRVLLGPPAVCAEDLRLEKNNKHAKCPRGAKYWLQVMKSWRKSLTFT